MFTKHKPSTEIKPAPTQQAAGMPTKLHAFTLPSSETTPEENSATQSWVPYFENQETKGLLTVVVNQKQLSPALFYICLVALMS